MSEQFSIMIGNRSRFEAGDPGGYWLDMPATKEQLQTAMQSVGITADNPQDFSIRGYSDDPEKHIALPYEMVCAADVDELNFLAARLEQLDPAEVGKLNAALQQKNGLTNIGQVIDFTYNVDFYVHIPEAHTYRDLGDYYSVSYTHLAAGFLVILAARLFINTAGFLVILAAGLFVNTAGFLWFRTRRNGFRWYRGWLGRRWGR